MKFFLSFFYNPSIGSLSEKQQQIVEMQRHFLDAIAITDYEYYDSTVYRGYPRILDELDQSDIFVALVDAGWISSTWKAIELYYAAGLSPENEGTFIQAPLPCYLYIDDDEWQRETGLVQSVFNTNLPHIRHFDGSWQSLFLKLKSEKSL